MRTHCKRLARLTLAFSKKLHNFKAAIALNIAYYNLVKTHGSLRCTPQWRLASSLARGRWGIWSMPRPEYIAKLQTAISETEHCASDHRTSIHVTEFFKGEIAWGGDVEVFDLVDHPEAKRCYSWSYDQDGATLATIVLKVPPVDSPQTAVKVAIAAKAREV